MASCKEMTIKCPQCGAFTAHTFLTKVFTTQKENDELRALILKVHQDVQHPKTESNE